MTFFPGIPDGGSPDGGAFWVSFWAGVYSGIVYSVFTGLFVGLAVWWVQRRVERRRERRIMEREAAALREGLRFALLQPNETFLCPTAADSASGAARRLVELLANQPLDLWCEELVGQAAFFNVLHGLQEAHAAFLTAAAALDVRLKHFIRVRHASQGTYSGNDATVLTFILGCWRGISPEQILPYLNMHEAPAWLKPLHDSASSDESIRVLAEQYVCAGKQLDDAVNVLRLFLERPPPTSAGPTRMQKRLALRQWSGWGALKDKMVQTWGQLEPKLQRRRKRRIPPAPRESAATEAGLDREAGIVEIGVKGSKSMSELMPAPEMADPTLTFPLTQRGFIELFGWISMYFATLDFFVTQVILRLAFRAKLDRASALTDRTTLGGKLRLLEGIRPEHVTDPAVLDEIHKLLPEALEVSAMRNRFTHDNWEFDGGLIATGRIKRVQFVGLDQWETNSSENEHSFEELAQFFNRIGELQKQFVDLANRLPRIIRFKCPQCGAAVEVVAPATPAAGREVTCSNCGQRYPIIASSGTPGG